VEIARGKTYRLGKDDCDCSVRLTYTPVRGDGVQGNPAEIVYGPVQPLPPSVSKVTVVQNNTGKVECRGEYLGGRQGQSVYEWKGLTPDGRILPLGVTVDPAISPPPFLTGCEVTVSYIPVRDDGARGTPVKCQHDIVVKPVPLVESVSILAPNARCTVGATIRCRAELSAGTIANYRWFRGTGEGNWERIPLATEPDYLIEEIDTGCYLVCEVEPTNAAGWKGKAVSGQAATPVGAGEGKLLLSPKDWTTGVQLETNASVAVNWQREEDGEWVAQAKGETYLLTANDIGKRIRATVKKYISEPTDPRALRTDILSYVRAVVRSKTLKFLGEPCRGGPPWSVIVDGTGVIVRGKGTSQEKFGRWSTLKCTALPDKTDELVLFLDASAKFLMRPIFTNDPRLGKALGPHARDFVVAAIDQFQRLAKQ
jgi:hypothetical protein